MKALRKDGKFTLKFRRPQIDAEGSQQLPFQLQTFFGESLHDELLSIPSNIYQQMKVDDYEVETLEKKYTF